MRRASRRTSAPPITSRSARPATAVSPNYQYQSRVNYDLAANSLVEQGGYSIVNASLAFTNPAQDVKVTFYVNKLFDKSYASFIGDNFNVFGRVHVLTQTLPRNADRYFGLRVKYMSEAPGRRTVNGSCLAHGPRGSCVFF